MDEDRISDLILGVVSPVGDQGGDIAKTAALVAGYPETVAGVQLNRFCASGLEAVNQAASRVRGGFEDLILAGGVESMSRVPMGSDGGAWAMDPETNYDTSFIPQGVGADLIAGSLIKNPGGGLAPVGGYICGRADLVEKCADRLTCVGMGKEVGCTLSQNREMLLGFFISPQTVASAVKTSVFACKLFEKLGFKTLPESSETRTDIIASILLENENNLTAFCQGIQKGSPVDSFVTPEAWDMPGYESKVIMAAGAFTMGASIELSADAPIREPFAAWLQGGITYPSGRMGILVAANEMCKKGLLNI
jgi:cystathionine beta-lyase family protein involved in aluminum resistance